MGKRERTVREKKTPERKSFLALKAIRLRRKNIKATLWAKYQVVPTIADQKATVPKAKKKERIKEFFRLVNLDKRKKTKTVFMAPIKRETCCCVMEGQREIIGAKTKAGSGGKGR